MKAVAPPGFQGVFGVARRDITPDLRIYARNWGAAEKDTAESIHQPLTLTVLTIQEHAPLASPLALVVLDLGWWRSRDEEIALGEAVQAAGIAPGRYVISLTHTHSGPIFCPKESNQPGGEFIEEYLASLCAKVTDAIGEALAGSVEGIWETASGYCPLAVNRDLPDPEGNRYLVGWNPAVGADGTLLVGRITSLEGRELATLVNYACHPTILAWENRAISPDFVGTMREVVEAETQSMCLFLQGASGELAPARQYVGDAGVAERAGRCLGYAVLSTLSLMGESGTELAYQGARESGAPLAIWESRPRTEWPQQLTADVEKVQLPIKADFPTLGEFAALIAGAEDRVQRERLQRKRLIREAMSDGAAYEVEHVLWRCGGILLLAVPNEQYSTFQQTTREAAGEWPLFVITLANGGRGYLVPEPCYEKDLYAMWQTPFAAGAFEASLGAAVRQIETVTREGA